MELAKAVFQVHMKYDTRRNIPEDHLYSYDQANLKSYKTEIRWQVLFGLKQNYCC